jgi:hypothetical protein
MDAKQGRRPWLTEVAGDDSANGDVRTGKERCRSARSSSRRHVRRSKDEVHPRKAFVGVEMLRMAGNGTTVQGSFGGGACARRGEGRAWRKG